MRAAGNRILASIGEARAYARGDTSQGLIVHVPPNIDVKAIRARLGLSQEAFARRFGLAPAAIRDWEQHRRQPDQAARVLLLVIAHNPEAIDHALSLGSDIHVAEPA